MPPPAGHIAEDGSRVRPGLLPPISLRSPRRHLPAIQAGIRRGLPGQMRLQPTAIMARSFGTGQTKLARHWQRRGEIRLADRGKRCRLEGTGRLNAAIFVRVMEQGGNLNHRIADLANSNYAVAVGRGIIACQSDGQRRPFDQHQRR